MTSGSPSSMQPAIEDGVADTGAHGDHVAQAKSEEISLKMERIKLELDWAFPQVKNDEILV